jgi:DNA-binding response OmpR family regulator
VLLKANRYETCFAADSMSAISEALKQRPDLIILDLGLPAGDGFIVMDRLRVNVNLSTIPVVIITARDSRVNRDRALKAGAVAFFQKPWDDNELLATIGNQIGPHEQPMARGA